jgi:DNA-binding CsgD family transcriptional regulator
MLQTKHQQEQDILRLIKDLQTSKETQVRDDIEKEMIARAIRN